MIWNRSTNVCAEKYFLAFLRAPIADIEKNYFVIASPDNLIHKRSVCRAKINPHQDVFAEEALARLGDVRERFWLEEWLFVQLERESPNHSHTVRNQILLLHVPANKLGKGNAPGMKTLRAPVVSSDLAKR